MSLKIVPCFLKEANAYIKQWHRHNGPVITARIVLAAADAITGEIQGVGIAGLPRARALDDGNTLEIYRCATQGAHNACSFLYGALWRAARAIGYTSMITYTLSREPGTSLRAVGWKTEAHIEGRSWDTPSRRRNTLSVSMEDKTRWRVSV